MSATTNICRKKKETSNTVSGPTSKPTKRAQRKSLLPSKLHQPPFDLFCHELGQEKATASSATKKTFEGGLESIVHILEHRKNVVVLVGAGISVSCGIPDFRSKGTGIYHNMDVNELGLSTPEELFHFEVFQDDPRPFYKFATKMLYPIKPIEPSPSHHFLSLLERKKILLRVYTQNIDGLEEKAGVSSRKIVYAHGSLNTSSCLKCGYKLSADDLREEILGGNIPHCRRVLSNKNRRRKRKIDVSGNSGINSSSSITCDTPVLRKTRCTSSESSTCSTTTNINVIAPATVRESESDPPPQPLSPPRTCNGVMKPNITFFGEQLVDRVRRCLEADRKKADAVIVIGTSLSVAPMSKIIEYLSPSIPRILINKKIVVPKHGSYGDGGRRERGGQSDGVVDGDDENDNANNRATNPQGGDRKDHRLDFVFDACLLGLCDEVTKSLTNIMESPNLNKGKGKSKLKSKQKRESILFEEGKGFNLLCNLPAIEKSLPKETLLRHPNDRIFVYPGACLDANNNADFNDDGNETSNELIFKEVVHCDVCHKVIEGIVMKCTDCFDFDLCQDCYSISAKDHFSGTHTFVMENNYVK